VRRKRGGRESEPCQRPSTSNKPHPRTLTAAAGPRLECSVWPEDQDLSAPAVEDDDTTVREVASVCDFVEMNTSALAGGRTDVYTGR
jgi:hypothetical protein